MQKGYSMSAYAVFSLLNEMEKRDKMRGCLNSQGARFLKIDLAYLSSQKRFDFRNS